MMVGNREQGTVNRKEFHAYSELLLFLRLFMTRYLFNLDYEKRGLYEGFIRGKINFKDNSLLHLREFVYVEISTDRKIYSYQYVDAKNNLIFRYDNTEHHRKLNLPNFPHHKHDGSENNVVISDAPFLADILKEIEKLHFE